MVSILRIFSTWRVLLGSLSSLSPSPVFCLMFAQSPPSLEIMSLPNCAVIIVFKCSAIFRGPSGNKFLVCWLPMRGGNDLKGTAM